MQYTYLEGNRKNSIAPEYLSVCGKGGMDLSMMVSVVHVHMYNTIHIAYAAKNQLP